MQDIFDPPGDGNCGFRAIAQAIGGSEYEFEKGWIQVRADLLCALEEHKSHFTKIFGGGEEVERLESSLEVPGAEDVTNVGKRKWYERLSMGPITAEAYRRPICFIDKSSSDCLTFVPMLSGPKSSVSMKPVYLAHVNGNHWTLLHVKPVSGVWPIPHLRLSKRMSSKESHEWIPTLSAGVTLFNKCIKGKLK